jgi:DNA mismatch repair ATPase MutS
MVGSVKGEQLKASKDLAEKALRATVIKYESWIDNVKDAVIKLKKILVEEGKMEAKGKRIELQDITEVINKVNELLPELKNKLWEKQLESKTLQAEINNLRNPVEPSALMLKIAELKFSLEKANKNKCILETRLDSKQIECEAMYEKGTPHTKLYRKKGSNGIS